jgi:hypothetical protein
MKKLILLCCITLSFIACKKNVTTATIQGTDLSASTKIYGYSAIEPAFNEPLEVYDDNGNYALVPMVIFGPTSSWAGWKINKGTKGYRLSPNEFPTQAVDIAKLSSQYQLSIYTTSNSSNYEFVFEADALKDVYYLKTNDGRYVVINIDKNSYYSLQNTKPIETATTICKFKIN